MEGFGGSMRAPWLLVLVLLLPLAAAGKNIKTTVLDDGVDDTPGDGICDTDSDRTNNVPATDTDLEIGRCTLRAAIQEANALPGPDKIVLRTGDLRYVLTLAGPGEDAAATGDLDITSEIEIVGKGYLHSQLDAKKLKDRILDVKPGGKLTLTSVALLSGKTAKEDFDPGSTTAVSGGCIRSEGELHLGNILLFRCASAGNGGALSVLAGTADLNTVIFHTPQAKGE